VIQEIGLQQGITYLLLVKLTKHNRKLKLKSWKLKIESKKQKMKNEWKVQPSYGYLDGRYGPEQCLALSTKYMECKDKHSRGYAYAECQIKAYGFAININPKWTCPQFAGDQLIRSWSSSESSSGQSWVMCHAQTATAKRDELSWVAIEYEHLKLILRRNGRMGDTRCVFSAEGFCHEVLGGFLAELSTSGWF
jgi:hypothetical protein